MTTDTQTFADAEQDIPTVEDHGARNKLVIVLLLVSAFVVILNETIMGVALPHLMADLDISASAAQWLTTAFMLTMAVVIPVTGYLLQRLNTRPVFILAMSLFSAGTLISALAPGFAMLVIGRIVQASGTAIMMPLLMTTVMTLVPPESRGRTMGNISIVISVAPAIGPTISGLILSVLEWRWLFLLVLPIALCALALGAMTHEERDGSNHRADRYSFDRPLRHRLRRFRLWPQRARRSGASPAGGVAVDSAPDRRCCHCDFRIAPVAVAETGSSAARPAHSDHEDLHDRDDHDGRPDDVDVRCLHLAADLSAERAGIVDAANRAAIAAGRPDHGPLRADGRAASSTNMVRRR